MNDSIAARAGLTFDNSALCWLLSEYQSTWSTFFFFPLSGLREHLLSWLIYEYYSDFVKAAFTWVCSINPWWDLKLIKGRYMVKDKKN